MRKVLILFLVCLNISLSAQINKNGIPLIKNYSPNDYSAHEQNWAICEDKRGVMYFGNGDQGILEFDGKKWTLIETKNNSFIRTLGVDSSGKIYVGCVDDFGYLSPNKKGKLIYHSLAPEKAQKFQNVWRIYSKNDEVYFCTNQTVYKYRNKILEQTFKDTLGGFISYYVHDKIYWGNYYKGLGVVEDSTVIEIPGGDFYKEKSIFGILAYSSNELFICTYDEDNYTYIYNTETGISKNISTINDDFKYLSNLLDQTQLYQTSELSNGNLVLSTLSSGCIIINKEGEILYHLSKENGLQDFTVITSYQSSNGVLWLGLNNGISYVEVNSPFSKFDAKQYGLEGIINDVRRYGNELYIATNLGLYLLEYDSDKKPQFTEVPTDYGIWKLGNFITPKGKDKHIVASNYTVFELKNKLDLVKLSDKSYDTRVVFQSNIHAEKLYAGHLSGLLLFEFENGKLIEKREVKKEEINSTIESIAEDEQGNLWLGTALDGVLKLNQDQTVVHYGLDEGLPDMSDVKVFFINNQLVCGTQKGLYSFNSETEKFEKYKGFGEKYFNNSDKINGVYIKNEHEYWITLVDAKTGNDYIERINISEDRIITIDDVPLKRLVKNSFQDIEFDGENGTWIATSDAIYNYNDNSQESFSEVYSSIIRKTEMGIDSIVFWGTYFKDSVDYIVDLHQIDELIKTVSYKNNSFNFYYSTPYIPTDEIKYSYMLEGFDDKWSAWDEKTENKYTNLDEGHYKFRVKAINIYDIESEIASYEFIIKPPWYKTILAYFVYFILAILVVIAIVKIYTRRLEQEKIRLEQIVKERTEEVVKQKDEIADKNRSITDSIAYACRIQTAILPSKEFAEEILPEHFILFRPRDIVSGDFYWMTKKGNNIVIIAADCTGHGVPGAFMSMLGVSFLNEIVNRHEVNLASDILNSLRKDIKKTLGQEGKEGEAKDGMDIALCIIDLEKMKMQYAGAYNPLYLFRNNELIEVKADRMPIGIYVKEKESFTNNVIDLHKGDVFYISSDGYQDQFGGEDGQKFKTKNYKQFLLEIHQKPMAEQREILDKRIDEWRGDWEQIDDIIIVGIRV
ncbi:MAG: SpoIIE family protein phosphatase [Bacteroidales bacterium]|jgi:serine phosphatase RsbU (regulator of sigma subunit)|nr:SpoIIE family protein phosphatase [Bacteroidales bacterium]